MKAKKFRNSMSKDERMGSNLVIVLAVINVVTIVLQKILFNLEQGGGKIGLPLMPFVGMWIALYLRKKWSKYAVYVLTVLAMPILFMCFTYAFNHMLKYSHVKLFSASQYLSIIFAFEILITGLMLRSCPPLRVYLHSSSKAR